MIITSLYQYSLFVSAESSILGQTDKCEQYTDFCSLHSPRSSQQHGPGQVHSSKSLHWYTCHLLGSCCHILRSCTEFWYEIAYSGPRYKLTQCNSWTLCCTFPRRRLRSWLLPGRRMASIKLVSSIQDPESYCYLLPLRGRIRCILWSLGCRNCSNGWSWWT